ncbi:PAS domain S-box protein [Aureimonas sp. ME7]|uniref:PAS domain S-box protein n=1 Tax=Aureimonas sp. ME7 TaxID=2744252 RepID=UPI0015FCDEF6|nr:PAS domain S-box protein [Aureimonas sp. ME7]
MKNEEARRIAARNRQIISSVTEFAIIATDRAGLVTEWNIGAEHILGWTLVEMIGRSAETIFTPEDRDNRQIQREMTTSLETGRGVDERWHLKKDGTRFWASGEMMPLRDEADEHIGFVKVLRDRTEQHLAGLRLREVEARLEKAQEVGGVGTFSVDIATGVLTPTSQFCRLFGLPVGGERPAQEFERLVIEDDQDLVSNNSTRAAGGAPRDVEYRIRRADTGELRWIARKGEFELDDGGRPVRFQGVARDITEKKEADQRLASSERKWRGLFEQLHEGFLIGCVVRDPTGLIIDWRYEEVNRAWGELVGIDPASVVGRTVRDLIPGVENEWIDEFARVVENGQPTRFTRQVGPLGRWYDGACQPIGDDRFSVIFLEVTDRVRAESLRLGLAELGEALGQLEKVEAVPSVAASIIGRTLHVGRVGYGTVAEDGKTFHVPSDWTEEGYPSLAGTYRMDDYGLYAEDLRQGRTVVIPDIRFDPRTASDTGPLEAVSVRSLINHPIIENGQTVAVLYVNDDSVRHWTNEEVDFLREAAGRTRTAIERRRAELSLRESEQRQKLALAIGDVGTFDLNLATKELVWDDRTKAAFGVAPDRTVSQDEKLAAVYSDDRSMFDAAFRAAMSGELFDCEFRVLGIDDKVLRWVAVQGRVVGETSGARHFVGAVRDVSARVAAEERRNILNRELAHRLKNTLAIVQAIATQTLRTASDLPSAKDALTRRIQTLSKAHDVLLTGQHDAGAIDAVIRGAVTLHDPDERISLRGPALDIGPKAALTLALIMHELSTNAAKYGALSVPDGKVHIAWVVDVDGEIKRPTLALSWREIDGPPTSPPTRKGFGTRLIEMGLSGSVGGSVELDYASDGLKCRIVAPLTEVQADDDV